MGFNSGGERKLACICRARRPGVLPLGNQDLNAIEVQILGIVLFPT